jgi:hypothetical protein
MTLQVHVEGRTPYEVEDQWMVKAKDTVALSGWIPVRVDSDDPERVAIDWDGVREQYERGKGALAGVDPGALAQAEQALSAMGINVDLSDAVVTTYGAPPAEEDAISKLERLAALHAGGALTDEEFAEQKRRVLDGP